jgi:hypothetical protein
VCGEWKVLTGWVGKLGMDIRGRRHGLWVVG